MARRKYYLNLFLAPLFFLRALCITLPPSLKVPVALPQSITCASLKPKDIDVTLISQASVERMWMVPHICERWSGKFVVALYSSSQSFADTVAQLNSAADVDTKIDASAVIDHRVSPGGTTTLKYSCARVILVGASVSGEEYPINKLRNIGINHSETTHYFVIDLDFWPSVGLYAMLTTGFDVLMRLASDPREALVVPALQMNRNRRSCRTVESCKNIYAHLMPQNIEALKACVRSRACGPFDLNNPGGHSSTHYNRWINAAEPQIRRLECIGSDRYEPYVVLRNCPSTPLYSEEFTGYGKNKMQLVLHLRHAGFRFSIIPSNFLIHFPHPDSKMKRTWHYSKRSDTKVDMKSRNDRLFKQFGQWLRVYYKGERIRVPVCGAEKSNAVGQVIGTRARRSGRANGLGKA